MAKKRRHSLGVPTAIVTTGNNSVGNILKTILIGGGCVVGTLVARKQYKLWKDRQDVKGEAGSTKKATITESQAQIYANKLYSAMKGAGTNENEVKQVFQACINDDDVNLIIIKFGKQNGQTLSEWINDDFSTSGKETYINSVLRAKGITKLF